MKNTVCQICFSRDISIDDSIKIDNKIYCSSCFEKTFPDEASLKNKIIEKEFDPTICSFCNKDFGSFELNKISAHPICVECEVTVKNKTFPKWVKAFLLGVLALVIAGFIWNWKFYQAYNEIKLSNAYLTKGDFAQAFVYMSAASQKVPEVEDLKTLSSYCHGVALLSKDSSEAALIEFNKCKDKIPDDYNLSSLIVQAKIGYSFENKDYQGFLEAATENLSLDSTSASSFSAVASAYACIYADKHQAEAKENALNYLVRAKAIDDTSKEMKGYYNMIEYRIDSKIIIEKAEFDKQFPNGWTKKL